MAAGSTGGCWWQQSELGFLRPAGELRLGGCGGGSGLGLGGEGEGGGDGEGGEG